MNRNYLIGILLLLTTLSFAQRKKKHAPQDAISEFEFRYTSWLNNDAQGPNAEQTKANLAFFKWLREMHGVQLDEYIVAHKGENIESLFEADTEDVNNVAKSIGTRLSSEPDHSFAYQAKSITGSHHRASSLQRKDMEEKSLSSSVDFCFSAPFDYWEDEFVLNVFGINASNEVTIAGNPWLLAEDDMIEFARLMRLRETHHKLLSKKKSLPKSYNANGYMAGNKSEKLLTLSNPSWKKKLVRISLDKEIGLDLKGKTIQIRSLYPVERLIGHYAYGQIVDLEVMPFRSVLYYISDIVEEDMTIMDLNYKIESDNKKEKVIRFYKNPNGANTGRIVFKENFKKYTLDGKEISQRKLRGLQLKNNRKRNREPYHIKLNRSYKFKDFEIDAEADALYESIAFAADNSALETNPISQNGWSDIPEVKNAQEAFLTQESFIQQDAWYKHLFDGNLTTAYTAQQESSSLFNGKAACLRLDLGSEIRIEKIKVTMESDSDLHPLKVGSSAYVEASNDLLAWEKIPFEVELESNIYFDDEYYRYIRMPQTPNRILEVEVFQDGKMMDSGRWKATNLFPHADEMKPVKMWRSRFIRPTSNIHKDAYFCIALEGKHGIEGAYVAAKVDNQYIGCAQRSSPYPTNNWLGRQSQQEENYTYYFPLTEDMKNKKIEFFVLAYNEDHHEFQPQLYLTSSDPFDTSLLVIKK